MNDVGASAGFFASMKVLLDGAKTIFGAAVIVLLFFGSTLLFLVGDKCSQLAEGKIIIVTLVALMFIILVGLVSIRIWKPEGLSGPLQPKTEQVTIRNSKIEP